MIIKLDPINIGRNYTVNFRLRDHLTKQPFELDSGDTLQIAFKQSAKSSSYLLLLLFLLEILLEIFM